MKRWGIRPSSCSNGEFRRRNCCGASKPTASGGSMAIWRNCCCRMVFKQPVRKESHWSLRHFLKPRQVNPLRLKRCWTCRACKAGCRRSRVPDPGGCAEDSREFPGRLSRSRLCLHGVPGLRLLRPDRRAGRFDLARGTREVLQEVRGDGRHHGQRDDSGAPADDECAIGWAFEFQTRGGADAAANHGIGLRVVSLPADVARNDVRVGQVTPQYSRLPSYGLSSSEQGRRISEPIFASRAA